MLKLSLLDYSDSYILVQGTISLTGQGKDTAGIQADIYNQEVMLKNSALLLIVQQK